MIKSFRNITLTDAQIEALDHLLATAKRKEQYARLIANLYNSSFLVDMRFCMAYLGGEIDGRLKEAVMLVLHLAEVGVESHEYFGVKVVEGLIEQYSMRAQDKPQS